MSQTPRRSRAHAPSSRPHAKLAWGVAALLCLLVAGALLTREKPESSRPDPTRAKPHLAVAPGIHNSAATQDTAAAASHADARQTGISSVAPAAAAPSLAGEPADLSQAAAALLKQGDLQGAIRLYQQALEKAPEDEELHFNIGIAYAQAQKHDAAEKHYREALRILPDYPEVHNNLGNLLLRLGNLEEAEQHLEQAVKLMPEYATAHNNLGIVRQRLKKPDLALESFALAVKNDTNYWQARFNFGNALLLSSNREGAIAEFRETLRINPSYEPAKRAMEKAGGQAQ